jgi:hypothetical protein
VSASSLVSGPGCSSWLTGQRRLGRQSRDMGLFKDDDGKGYLLTEDVCALPFMDLMNE